jgi:polyferredoxin
MSTPTSPREAILRESLSPHHRYRLYRFLAQCLSAFALYAVPFSGLARLDLVGGEHRFLLRPVGAFEASFAVLTFVGLFYLAASLANPVAGRLFCGWGCLCGQAARFAERTTVAARTHSGRLRALVVEGSFAVALGAGLLAWFVDPASLAGAGWTARWLTGAAFAALCVLALVYGRRWRWAFCRKACPVGLYYSLVTPAKCRGVVFEGPAGACAGCDACTRICPVGLDPRDLAAPCTGIGGLAFDGLPALTHCLACGDCVEACESTTRDAKDWPALLHFGIGEYGRLPASAVRGQVAARSTASRGRLDAAR